MLENVAAFLPEDEDLASFMASCNEVRYALLTSRSGIWRSRYDCAFDRPRGLCPSLVLSTYIARKRIIREANFTFHRGRRSQETHMASLMKDLINGKTLGGEPRWNGG